MNRLNILPTSIPGFAWVAVIDGVRGKKKSLSIALYVRQKNAIGAVSWGNAIQEKASLGEVIDKRQKSSAALRLIMDELLAAFRKHEEG
jgi:hypothetical protein